MNFLHRFYIGLKGILCLVVKISQERKEKQLMNICPCLSSRSVYATCGRYLEGLMVPSGFERENYCFGIYELCPIFNKPVTRNASMCVVAREETVLV